MSISKQTVIFTTFITLVLFLVGMYTWNSWFMLVLPKVADVIYLSAGFGNPFLNSLFFSITLALIPLTTVLIWKYSPIFNTQRKILTVSIIIIVMTVSVIIRREMIKSQAKNLQPATVLDGSDPTKPQLRSIEYGIKHSTLKFELFAFAGLLAGGCISFISLRQQQK